MFNNRCKGGFCQGHIGVDKKGKTSHNGFMKIILSLIVLLGIVSAASFKLFLEPVFFANGKQTKSQLDLSHQEQQKGTSGFAVDTNPTGVLLSPTKAGTSSVTPAVDIKTRLDKKAITLTFKNLTDIVSIDYTLSYLAKGVTKGVNGKAVPAKLDQTLTREILLGTCSGAVCTYDAGVTSIDVSVVFTLKDNTVKKVEKTYFLE